MVAAATVDVSDGGPGGMHTPGSEAAYFAGWEPKGYMLKQSPAAQARSSASQIHTPTARTLQPDPMLSPSTCSPHPHPQPDQHAFSVAGALDAQALRVAASMVRDL